MAQAFLEIRDLHAWYGESHVLHGVNLDVNEGEVVTLLGRNGAGKTTTLKLLLGLLRADAGQAFVDGIDVATNRIGAARRIGALLEAHGFYAHLGGRANLNLSRRLLGVPAGEVDRVLEVTEMTQHAGRRVSDYSLGMRQRLGLARAMLGAPPVLVLDEPTNGLDPEGIADMRGFLRALPERTGATVLLSSHLLGEIEQTATHVGVLSEGKLVLEGALSELKAGLGGELAIEADDLAGAAVVAQSHGFEVERDDAGLVATLKPGDELRAATAALGRALCAADIAIHALTPRVRSLETLYRQAAQPRVSA